MRNTVKLKKAAEYYTDRIDISEISIENFVTTDNLLQNKDGVGIAANLPPQNGTTPAFKKNNILVSNIRPYLKKIWYADTDGGCSADVLVINTKTGYDSKFVYYSLFRDDFFAHMMNGAKGTKMPRGDKSQVLDFLIPDFDLSTQQKIASVLSSLDSKIALNKSINAELEAMSKTLYDYWFVQFDFPDPSTSSGRAGKPYKSSGGKMVWNEELNREVPEGWEVKKLSEIANITTGKLDSNAEVLGGKYYFYTCAENPTRTDSFAFDDSVILVAGNNASGNFHINRYSGKFNAYQRTYVITAKEENNLDYLYQVLERQLKVLKTRGQGSQTKFLTINMLTDISIFKTDISTIEQFHMIVNPLYLMQQNVLNENQQLSSLRDWLLPMLMNGQVRVGDKIL